MAAAEQEVDIEMERRISELEPLETGHPAPKHRPSRQTSRYSRSCYRAPLKVVKLLTLLIVLPTTLIMVPLYMRYRVYSGQMYPMGMTDMRLIDSKISTTWCQRQVVKANTTFNAFVVPSSPALANELVPVSMTRELELEDDMKEYWGFYLLQGSTVTVSACVRRPGASLVMIKGYKHLKDCAYIGDDSSEEIEELERAYELGLLPYSTLVEKKMAKANEDGKANHPDTMKRHKAGVSFHDPSLSDNDTVVDLQGADVDPDPKELREILDHLHAIREAAKEEQAKNYHPPAHLMSLPALHRHRDANVDREERKYLIFTDIDGKGDKNSTEEDTRNTDLKTGEVVLLKLNIPTKDSVQISTVAEVRTENKTKMSVDKESHTFNKTDHIKGEEPTKEKTTTAKDITKEESRKSEEKIDIEIVDEDESKPKTVQIVTEEYINGAAAPVKKNDTKILDTGSTELNINERSNEIAAESATSKEIFEEVLIRLQKLGDRGKRVLKRLHHSMGMTTDDKLEDVLDQTPIMKKVQGTDEELDRLRRILMEAIDEEKTRPQRTQKRKAAAEEARAKRELWIGVNDSGDYERMFNDDDEERNFAAEEGVQADGYAEHHTRVNETTPLDMSNSEFWSSFSSSEEALLECEGLILSLPLTPDSRCEKDSSSAKRLKAAQKNAVTYRVPANGYYFFVFNSENEVEKNYISVKFDLQKTRYDIARTALRECRNSTERCDLMLDLFSNQKVVLELPLRDNDTLWNEQFVVISECEHRTSIYIFCAITVPLLIMVFGFQ